MTAGRLADFQNQNIEELRESAAVQHKLREREKDAVCYSGELLSFTEAFFYFSVEVVGDTEGEERVPRHQHGCNLFDKKKIKIKRIMLWNVTDPRCRFFLWGP